MAVKLTGSRGEDAKVEHGNCLRGFGFSTLPASGRNPSGTEETSRAQYAQIVAAYAERDIKKAVEPYVADNRHLLFDAVAPFQDVGRERLIVKTREFFEGTTGPLAIRYDELTIKAPRRRFAFAHSIIHVLATRKDGATIKMRFRMPHIFEKLDGKWLIVHERNSVPLEGILETPKLAKARSS